MKRRTSIPIFERPLWHVFFITMLLAILSGSLNAAENLKNVKLSDGTLLTLNGIGKAKQLSDDYYFGALYLIEPFGAIDDITYINNPKRMQIRIAYKSISARRFGQYWKEAIAINNPRNIWEPQVNSVLEFTKFFHQKLLKGDIINLDFLPDRGTFVYLNGVLLGDIRNPSFYNLLLMTWLGERPPNPDFKKSVMRALANEDADQVIKIQQKFLLLRPTDKRIKQVAAEQKKNESDLTGIKAAGGKEKPKPKAIARNKAPKKKTKAKTVKKTPVKKVASNKKKKADKKSDKTAKIAAKTVGKVIEKIPAGAEIAAAKTTTKIKAPLNNDKQEKTKKAPNKKKIAAKVKTEDKPEKLSASERLKIFEARSEYGKLLRRKIREHQSYPLKKVLRVRKYRKLMEKGPMKSEGILWVKIARDGSVLSTRMEESTKISILDAAAIQMVEKADPLPPMPKLLVGNDFEFLIKVAFLSPKLN